jgi:hypothetical protein
VRDRGVAAKKRPPLSRRPVFPFEEDTEKEDGSMIHFDGSPVHRHSRLQPLDPCIDESDADLVRRWPHLGRLSEHALTWAEAVLENQLRIPRQFRHHDLIVWLADELRKHNASAKS